MNLEGFDTSVDLISSHITVSHISEIATFQKLLVPFWNAI